MFQARLYAGGEPVDSEAALLEAFRRVAVSTAVERERRCMAQECLVGLHELSLSSGGGAPVTVHGSSSDTDSEAGFLPLSLLQVKRLLY